VLDFDWDEGNTKHTIEDYPERQNTIESVQSIFEDPMFSARIGKIIDGEQRYIGLGKDLNQIVKIVVFVIREEKIRPISCWKAKEKVKNQYHEKEES
jgi:uncharacterized DUF497 family protein